MKEYTQLTQPQRYEISALHKVGQGPTQIARMVGVHRTTISRELKRNRSPNEYYPQAAHQRSQKRRTDRSRRLKWTGRCRRIELKANCATSGALSRLPPGSGKTNRSLYHMSEFTHLSIWNETAKVDFIPTYANTNNRSGFRPKRRIKAQFPTGFPLMTVPPSWMKRLESVMGKSI